MIYLVSPDCVLYVISDTHPDGPDVQQLRQLRSDMPPPKNFNQLSGWTTGPHVGRGNAGNWQHLDDVRWIEDASGDLFPLVGSAQNAMKIFNARLGTSYVVDASFRKLLSGADSQAERQTKQELTLVGEQMAAASFTFVLKVRHHHPSRVQRARQKANPQLIRAPQARKCNR